MHSSPQGRKELDTAELLHFHFHLSSAAAAAAKSLQSCPTLCDPMDCSLPRFSVHGIFQATLLEWVAIPCHPLLQGIFPTQGSNPHLLHLLR